MRVLLLQGAMAGPVAAALVWLLLMRWPLARRIAAGVVALAASAGGWAVFWLAYRGDPPVWRSFGPDLLGATVVAVAGVGVLLVALRADVVRRGMNAPTVVALGIASTALVAAGYSDSLAVHALVLPVPTLAAAIAALSGRGRRDARGLLGLAVADAVALVGLSVVYARTDTALVSPSTGLGVGLILGAAAAKVGALPGLATWRLASTGGPGSVVAAAVRGHGMVLVALAGVVMARGERMLPMAIAAAAVMLVAGSTSLAATRPASSAAAVVGTAFGLPFLALGLGGTVGVRSFLVLFPALLLAAGVVAVLAARDPDPAAPRPRRRRRAAPAEGPETTGATEVAEVPPSPPDPTREEDRPVRAPWAWLATVAMGVGVGSLLGAPPGGGFPGTWLALSLAAARAEATQGWLLIAGGAAVGLAVALVSAAGLIRSARPRPVAAAAAAIGSLGLLYVGTQPVRLALGWWVRIETALGMPEVLPAAEAPGLPPVGGLNLLLAAAPAIGLALLVTALGLGLREPDRSWVPPAGPRRKRRAPGRLRTAVDRAAKPLAPVAGAVERLRRVGVGFAVAAAFEMAALLVAGRLVLLAARAGFL